MIKKDNKLHYKITTVHLTGYVVSCDMYCGIM